MPVLIHLITALCLAVFLVLVPSGESSARQTFGLTPETDWKVTRIDAKSPQGKPYCVMATRFNKNVILSLAQNAQAGSSMALDFQSPKLVEGAEYDLKLKVEGIVTRDFRVNPVSKEAFVVRLAYDPEFIDALVQRKTLVFEFKQSALTFDLQNIDEGFQKLAECVDNLPADLAATSEEPGPQNDEQSKDVSAENTAAEAYTQTSKTAPASVSDVPETREEKSAQDMGGPGNLNVPRGPVSLASNTVSGSAAVSARPSGENASNENENNDSNSNAPQVPVPAERPQIASLNQNTASSGGMSAAKSETLGNQDNSARVQELKEKVAFLENKNARLEQTLNSVGKSRQENNDALSQKTKDLSAKLSALVSRQAELQEERRSLISQNKALENQLKKKDEQLAQIESQMSDLPQDEVNALKTEKQVLEQEVADLKLKLDEVMSGKTQVSQDVSTLSAQLKELNRKYFEEKQKLQNEIARLEEDKKSLNARLNFSESARERVEQLRVRLEEQEQENEALLEKIAALEVDRLQTIEPASGSAFASGSEEAEIELIRLREENINLIERINSMRNAGNGREVCLASENMNIEKMAGRYQEAQKEIVRLGKALRDQRKRCSAQGSTGTIASTLLDPRLSSESQKKLYTSLSGQLENTQALLQEQREKYEIRIRALKQQLTGQKNPGGDNFTALARGQSQTQNTDVVGLVDIEPAAGGFMSRLADEMPSEQRRSDTGSPPDRPISLTGRSFEQQKPVQTAHNFPNRDGSYQNPFRSNPQTADSSVRDSYANTYSPDKGVNAFSQRLSNLLQSASIPVSGMIFDVSGGSGSTKSFRWDTGQLLGSADYIEMPGSQNSAHFFREIVRQHLNKIKNRCDGRFTSQLTEKEKIMGPNKGKDIIGYSISCISKGNQDVYASLLFVNEGTGMVVYKHESQRENDHPAALNASRNLANAIASL